MLSVYEFNQYQPVYRALAGIADEKNGVMGMIATTLNLMIQELKLVTGIKWALPKEIHDKEAMVKTLMTIAQPTELGQDYYNAEKNYLIYKNDHKSLISIEEINEPLIGRIQLFNGDITTIQSDAIVNAANEKLLGCFVPGHHCIDNAIHMSAGLGLRMACYALMKQQGYDEPVGLAKVTFAYNLPSKYVIHTVGPNVNGPVPLTQQEVIEQLKACYISILKAVESYKDIHNIVFCSISTGVYGVPIALASEIALTTINDYLEQCNHSLDKVVINVFSDSDYDSYKVKAKELARRK